MWIGIDSETKAILSYRVGKRGAVNAYEFIGDLSRRMAEQHRCQLTTDGLEGYINAVDEHNLTVRMHLRRFTRLTNGFSKKLENLKAAFAVFMAWYNFFRVHQTLRVTPAMEAKLTDHVWTIQELLTAA